jgi:hypothetical protein
MRRDCFVVTLLAMTDKKGPRKDAPNKVLAMRPPSVVASAAKQPEGVFPLFVFASEAKQSEGVSGASGAG